MDFDRRWIGLPRVIHKTPSLQDTHGKAAMRAQHDRKDLCQAILALRRARSAQE
jgi:hypothetical protein